MNAFARLRAWGASLLLAAVMGSGLIGLSADGAQAEPLSALARYEPARSAIHQASGELTLSLGLSQPVPYRVFMLDSPPRLVVDFREVDFSGAAPDDLVKAAKMPGVTALRWGKFRPGWSRMVAELDGPYAITRAEERTADPAALEISLKPVDAVDFATRAGTPQSALWDLPQPADVERTHPRQDGTRPLIVVLDPGHGGIDPGAEAGVLREAVLVMTFARDLKEQLTRAGIKVIMTREEDVFVPLETRMSVARAVGADLFLSLHADALAEGEATGATIYLLDDKATDAATEKLAERHDRADLLAGVDLEGHDDQVAGVLMDLARTETQPRSTRLAASLRDAITGAGLSMHKHPVQGAAFSVLKSADIPSILLELGFLSSPADQARLNDPVWRGAMSAAIVKGVLNWAGADAAEGRKLRQ
jgi:N-acetylmuramoyl-L-alanine amidase